MDSEKTTLNDTRAEHETEYNEVLSELREAVFRIRPSDVYQFCASYFDQKLAEQREGLLKLIDMNPGVLDAASTSAEQAGAAGEASNAAGRSQQPNEAPRETGPETSDSHDDAHVRMRNASEHAWSSGGTSGAMSSMINPNFSFGGKADDTNMTVDEDTAEARDKFSSLVSMPPAGNVQPFAGRRFSVSAESMNPTTEPEYKKKFVPKTDTQKQRIREALDNNFLFKNMDEDSYRDVIDAMEEKHVRCGQSVIVQGGVGDYFYIVEYGSFDIFVRKGDAQPVKVATVEDSGSFGELALMYNAPRAATVTATSDATLWALDRITFRSLLMERTSRKRRLYERFLETVPLLKSLEAYERQKIADALESVTYEDKDTIVRQGDPGDDFFLIEQGSIRVYKTDDEGVSREYPPLTQGGYFGELALLDNQPRQATLIACGRTKCARMSKDAFDRLLGPVINIIRREAGNYTHIQSLTKS
ncbi:hypothetical protein LPJ78_005305 [Coemansia sp. RSA 989]|nr:hypothetical protein LPJ68_005726 [Coemansia sp. RSA 1086]KAJ1747276.1 hypothetical protein LPJ79_005355 [Coemansia sp. RSA 1821]KAJ1861470.1 hypothetical protein LPJ78_005305 [Coemansia sp. RSA 989]KAJ1869420.1 hypothetical protein LPJ55_005375 [Coemansia sp. RSA 990]KAJ2626805.1 hypothetical protein H4R22_004676 [Coemansia sp. RSA 1290]KAJ2645994.1 hypothetical protein IWW40_005717 [Coemansia sp. RSA 1250]KAJ2674719.1 hypothetical protein IWW42_001565 [Coemansia sp. RSA 1085]